MVTALISLCLVTIAAATKPISGLFVIAILIAICADAIKTLRPLQRNRLIISAFVLVSAYVAAYLINYLHLVIRGMPSYPVTELSERLSRAVKLLNTNFSLPFRILVFAGLALSPFVPRIRWLTLPLLAGFWLWADTASYDLRNLLGLLLISAFIPLYALARHFMTTRAPSNERRWSVPDATIAACVAIFCVGLTLPLAQGDTGLKQRFANEQLSKGFGFEVNQNIEKLLVRGCMILSADGYISTISAFQRFRDQMDFFHYNLPLTDLLAKQIHQSTGCTAILYPPSATHPSILDGISAAIKARSYMKVIEHRGMELLVAEP
jgi:hypothetical protein